MDAKPKRWTKREIKSMTGAIDSFRLVNRPLPSSFGTYDAKSFEEKFRAAVEKHRVDIVKAGLRELREIAANYAKKDRELIAHLQKNPHVYGDSTPEVIGRTEKGMADSDKAVAWFDRLIARIDAEGLPPEVIAYF